MTLFPVMTLSAIVTVAPVVNPVAHGIETPPPKVTTVSGTELFRPPVIVTARIHTALTGPFWRPIVTTGPPPLMVVLFDPAPIRLTLTSIVTPPARART